MTLRKSAIIVLSTLLVSACGPSPTGKNQIKFFAADKVNSQGVQAFEQLKKQQKISKRRADIALVQCVAKHITAQVPKKDFSGPWEVVVFDEPQINAFALPGGKIGVYKGLLNVTENQHQLATVIGHEVGHVIAEHSNQRLTSNTAIDWGLKATNVLLRTKNVANSQHIMSALGLGAQVGVKLPFGRAHESEADEIGLDLMAKAGFDPKESVKLWINMDKATGNNKQPELLSTHPNPSTRIDQLLLRMTKADSIYERSAQKPSC